MGPNIEPDSEGMTHKEQWLLSPKDDWHGFGSVHDNFNMLDPIKATIVTPGLNLSGEFNREIPASVVTRYLSEHGVIVEKTGLYSFYNVYYWHHQRTLDTLLAALQQFKDDYDKNQPMWRVLPEFHQL